MRALIGRYHLVLMSVCVCYAKSQRKLPKKLALSDFTLIQGREETHHHPKQCQEKKYKVIVEENVSI